MPTRSTQLKPFRDNAVFQHPLGNRQHKVCYLQHHAEKFSSVRRIGSERTGAVCQLVEACAELERVAFSLGIFFACVCVRRYSAYILPPKRPASHAALIFWSLPRRPCSLAPNAP